MSPVGAAIGIAAGSGVVCAGIGWFYSSLLLDTTQHPTYPERVLDSDARSVTLATSRFAQQAGTWGLRWPGALAIVGSASSTGPGQVRRMLLAGPVPPPGTAAVLDAGPYDPDPGAHGLTFLDIEVPTPLGSCPGWVVPGTGHTWAVLVHGRGGGRREGLRILPALHRIGMPVLAASYRNDEGAPASPDGHYHLGDTEWIDVEAAVRYALDHGARDVVLYGWSMGAAIIGAFLNRSPVAAAVVALVWDAPLVDWRATLRRQARNRGVPAGLTPLATAATSLRIGIDFDRFDLRRRPPAVRPPTLIVHGTEDTAVPVTATRALVTAAPGLGWPIRYLEVAGAEHTAAWNADPRAYEQAVTGFLADVAAEQVLLR